MSLNVTSTGVQVHGGMGFIEETGAAQYYRDAQILTIYEGTTAIQANDLVGRKTYRDAGVVVNALLAQVYETENKLAANTSADLQAIASQLGKGRLALAAAVAFVVTQYKQDIKAVYAGSVPYLKLAGIVLAGWQMARAALIADSLLQTGEGDVDFLKAKIITARFFADHILSAAEGLRSSIMDGSAGVLGLAEEQF
jgi:butyryl-CoA dehydrogenase